MVDYSDDIVDAVNADFGNRSREATQLADVAGVIGALKHAKTNLREWMKPVAHQGMFPDAEWVEYQPLGVVGLISPWNFPFNLTSVPLSGIVAAGNRVLIKRSEFTPVSTAQVRPSAGSLTVARRYRERSLLP